MADALVRVVLPVTIVMAGLLFMFTLSLFLLPVIVPLAGYLFYVKSSNYKERKAAKELAVLYEHAQSRFSLDGLYTELRDDTLTKVLLDILIREGYTSTPEPPPIANSLAGARYRDTINNFIKNVPDLKRICQFLDRVFAPYAQTSSTGLFSARVPLSADDVHHILSELVSDGRFPVLTDTVDRTARQLGCLPTEYKGDPTDFFRGTALAPLAYRTTAVDLKNRNEHTLCLASTGAGKTQLIQYLISKDLEEDCTTIVIDNQRQTIPKLARLGVDMQYLSPHFPLALNLFDLPTTHHTAPLLQYVLSGLMNAPLTAKQELVFQFGVSLMLAHKGNLYDFQDLLAGKQFDLSHVDATTRRFFTEEYYKKGREGYESTRSEISWRIWSLLKNPILRDMFAAKDNKCALEMDRKLILIDCDIDLLQDYSGLFGRFFLAQLLLIAQQRFVSPGRPVYVYVDECFASGTPVLTDAGYRPIEDLKAGDKVMTAFGYQPVKHAFSRIVTEWYEVELSNGQSLTVTTNHPLFTDEGWKKVSQLQVGSTLLYYYDVLELTSNYDLSNLSQGKTKAQQDLFAELWSEAELEEQPQEARCWPEAELQRQPSSSQNLFATNTQKPSDARPIDSSQSQPDAQAHWSSTQSQRWQRTANANSATNTFGSSWRRLVRGAQDNYNAASAEAIQRTPLSQNRHSQSDLSSSSRGGRRFAHHLEKTCPRPKKECCSSGVRVESIAFHQHSSHDNPKRHLRVYNLHVEGHPSYVVGEILAHNCYYYLDQSVLSMLEISRKANIGLFLAHQFRAQITEPKVSAALMSLTSTKFAAQLSPEDTRAMASAMLTTPDFITAQKKLNFALWQRGETTVSIEVPAGVIEAMPQHPIPDMTARYGRTETPPAPEITEPLMVPEE